LCKRYL